MAQLSDQSSVERAASGGSAADILIAQHDCVIRLINQHFLLLFISFASCLCVSFLLAINLSTAPHRINKTKQINNPHKSSLTTVQQLKDLHKGKGYVNPLLMLCGNDRFLLEGLNQ